MLIFKKIKPLIIIFSTIFAIAALGEVEKQLTKAYFSPRQGKLVFEEMYKAISQAKKYVHISIYSWSDAKIKNSLLEARKNGADVRILLHPPLYRNKERVQKWSLELEQVGAEVKIAKMQMHEKIVIVDDYLVINSSANMSSGPKSKYSENWIFHYRDKEIKNIFDDFSHEFSILWNTGKDIFTHEEAIADETPFHKPEPSATRLENLPDATSHSPLYSSSMNYTLKRNKESSADYKQGKYFKMFKRKDQSKKQTWLIKGRVLAAIKSAEENISCAFNHLYIEEIALALVNASKRGVNVRLAVDNQEYTTGYTKTFVQGWKKIEGNKGKVAPVRIKVYSVKPSPAYWFLNHHKFCVIDYNTENPQLINGSYNFSKTAELTQFDNQVFYTTDIFNNLYDSFQEEFEFLYYENRTQKDRPSQKIIDKFFEKTSYGAYPLHIDKPVALTWEETRKLRSDLNKVAPGITRTGQKQRDCRYYKFIKREGRNIVNKYYGCPRK